MKPVDRMWRVLDGRWRNGSCPAHEFAEIWHWMLDGWLELDPDRPGSHKTEESALSHLQFAAADAEKSGAVWASVDDVRTALRSTWDGWRAAGKKDDG